MIKKKYKRSHHLPNKDGLLVGILVLLWLQTIQVTTAAPLLPVPSGQPVNIKTLLQRAENTLFPTVEEIQPVVDLVQVINWPLYGQSSSLLYISKESRLAFGEFEDQYSNNNMFYLLGYQGKTLGDQFVHLLVDTSLKYIVTLQSDTTQLVLKPFQDLLNPLTHFTLQGPLNNCMLGIKENSDHNWKLTRQGDTPVMTLGSAKTYFELRSLGSVWIVKE